jgi:predicted TIM-barrel fold metal-dependent hydrolase
MNFKTDIIDAHTHVGISINNYLATASYPYAMTVEDLIVRMDFLGIEKSVVFPFESSYYPLLGDEKALDSNAMSSFPYEKENENLLREIYDVFPEYSDRLIPFMMFDPSRETEKQATHLGELRKRYKIFGLKTVTTYIKAFAADFGNDENHIRNFALEHKLPITFHCSWDNNDIWANVFDILDVVEKNPTLNFCLAHTVRFSREALGRADSLPNCFVDISAFKIHCELATQNSTVVAEPEERFVGDYSEPAKVLQALAEAYPDTIIWGSDTPYHNFAQKFTDKDGNLIDCKLRANYDDEINILKSLPKNLIEKISFVNTLKFLSIEDVG